MKKLLLFLVFFLFAFSAFNQSTKDTLIPYRDNNLWGFANRQLKIIIKPAFDTVCFFEDDRIIAATLNNRLALVQKNKKWGLINTKGQFVVPCKHEELSRQYGGYQFVERDKKGMYSSAGKLIVPAIYDEFDVTNGKYIVVSLGGKKGLLSPEGKVLLPLIYKNVYVEDPELAVNGVLITAENFNNQEKYFDKNGIKAQPKNNLGSTGKNDDFQMSIGIAKQEGVSQKGVSQNSSGSGKVEINRIIKNGKKYGYLYQRREYSSDGLSNWWLTDTLPPVYDSLIDIFYYKNLFLALKGNQWGAVDIKGNVKIQFKYDLIETLGSMFDRNGKLVVCKNKKWGVIDFDKEVVPIEYDEIVSFAGHYKLRTGDKWGGLLTMGQTHRNYLIPARYFKIVGALDTNGLTLLWVRDGNGRTGFVDERGFEYFRD